MPPSAAPDEVVLALPASPEFVRLARLTCAGIATRVGMGYDEVEDLRIAVGEACSLLIGGGRRTGTLTLTFGVLPDAVAVRIDGDFGGAPPEPVDGDLSDQILDAVVDEHVLDLPGDSIRIAKRHRGATEAPDEVEPA